MIRSLCTIVAIVVSTFVAGARYITLTDSLTASEIYPGTTHTIEVTVPDSYDGSLPAALYLGLDGILCRAPEVTDSLALAGQMPVTVCVFLQPGVIRDSDGRVLRYNRSNEFDAIDPRFAAFIATELLPAVERMELPDGRRLRFSANPADRMIFGLSSGGIAAFAAAWHRPDLFGKVYSGCGTFVPMRGGNDLQAIVRKHEPRPLRIFLQDGYSDTWNPLFGSWYEANRMLASALEFAGYDCRFDWAPGGHSVRRTSEIFPEVMKWMWRDRNTCVASGTGNDLLAPLLEGDSGWEPVTVSSCGGAARSEAVYPDGSVAAATVSGSNRLMQYICGADGERMCGQPFYWLHAYDNSLLTVCDLEFDSDGNLWVLTSAGIQICDQNGRVRGILALPCAVSEGSRLCIEHGAAVLESGGKAYRRRLHVAPATPGVRPRSQGQA